MASSPISSWQIDGETTETVFPVVIYGCESWIVKNAERRRIDAFKLWWWRRLLRVPWTARTSNKSILKEINLEYSLEGLMLKLKLQYFGHLMQSANSLKKTWCWERLKAGEGQQRTGITDSTHMSLSKLWELVKDGEAWHAEVYGVPELNVTDWPNNNNNKQRNGRHENAWGDVRRLGGV